MNSLLFIFLGLLSFCVNDEDLVKVKPINESFIEVIYKNYLESKNIDYQDLNTIDVAKISGRKERIASAYADKMLQVTGSVDNQKLSPTNIVARLDSCSIEKLKIYFIPNSNATTITKTIPVFIFYDSITKLEKKFVVVCTLQRGNSDESRVVHTQHLLQWRAELQKSVSHHHPEDSHYQDQVHVNAMLE